ncbi:MAG: L-threonylcarbamoyladenylate synthase [Candidatus Berkelbacteria bacterium]|nr:L-threonylcarbamoyladenylate synthase [Candidatus Berkelbacteria bacterium]
MQIINIELTGYRTSIERASQMIMAGQIVIAPFDTVYGMIADPRDEEALAKINQLKGRPETKTLGVAVDSIQTLTKITDINQENLEFIRERIPGRYSFILNDNPANMISNQCKRGETISCRIPDSDLIIAIAKASGGIIAQTSANKSGLPNCYSLTEFLAQFSKEELDQIDLFIDGGTLQMSAPSELWNLTGNQPEKIERS